MRREEHHESICKDEVGIRWHVKNIDQATHLKAGCQRKGREINTKEMMGL